MKINIARMKLLLKITMVGTKILRMMTIYNNYVDARSIVLAW